MPQVSKTMVDNIAHGKITTMVNTITLAKIGKGNKAGTGGDHLRGITGQTSQNSNGKPQETRPANRIPDHKIRVPYYRDHPRSITLKVDDEAVMVMVNSPITRVLLTPAGTQP